MSKNGKRLEEMISKDFRPSLNVLTKYFQSKIVKDRSGSMKTPLVGEEDKADTAAIAFIVMGVPTLINAYSGTGKSILKDALKTLIDPDELYEINVSRKTATWYQSEAINRAKYVIFNEAQRSTSKGTNDETLEILKDWGEGNDAKRTRTDMAKSVSTGKNAVNETILYWKPFLTDLALHNRSSDLNKDEEFMRRVIRIQTDPSEEMTKKVTTSKMNAWKEEEEPQGISEEDAALLRVHLSEASAVAAKVRFVNPAADAIMKIVPCTFCITRSQVDYLKSITNGIAAFYFKERYTREVGGKKNLYITPEDIYYMSCIYLDSFIERCMQIPLLGKEILKVMRGAPSTTSALDDWGGTTLSAVQIMKGLQRKGLAIEKYKMMSIIGQLIQNSYIEEMEMDRKKMYVLTDRFAFARDTIDWNEVLNEAKRNSPDDEYLKYCSRDYVITDPMTGHRETFGTMIGRNRKKHETESAVETKKEVTPFF